MAGQKASYKNVSFWAGAQICFWQIFFPGHPHPYPLPLARERENRRLPFGKSRRWTGRRRIRTTRIERHLFLLPGGEGQDEGEPFTKTDLRPMSAKDGFGWAALIWRRIMVILAAHPLCENRTTSGYRAGARSRVLAWLPLKRRWCRHAILVSFQESWPVSSTIAEVL